MITDQFEYYYSETDNLRQIFINNIKLVDNFSKNVFGSSDYSEQHIKNKGRKPDKNIRDVEEYEINPSLLESSAFQAANNNFREGNFHAVLVGGTYNHTMLTGKRTEESFVFVFYDDKVKLYKSKARYRYGYGIIAWGLVAHAIASIDTKLNKKRREDKTLQTFVFSREDFLSRISYDSGDISNKYIGITIILDGKKYRCEFLYQPYLHLFLNYIENGFKEKLTKGELQKIVLDKYLFNFSYNKKMPKVKEPIHEVNNELEKDISRNCVAPGNKSTEYDEYGFDKDGYNREGYDAYGYDREGYNRKGYNKKGYDRFGFDREGYNKFGFDREGYDKDGYDGDGYDNEGFDKKGYDRYGYDRKGYDHLGFDKNGYNVDGYNSDGYNSEGYDKNGYDKYGCDTDGYNDEGYDQNGYDICGYNKDGYDKNGFDKNGYDKTGYDKEGYDREGYDKHGWDRRGFPRG